jgi:hypothetical protein
MPGKEDRMNEVDERYWSRVDDLCRDLHKLLDRTIGEAQNGFRVHDDDAADRDALAAELAALLTRRVDEVAP